MRKSKKGFDKGGLILIGIVIVSMAICLMFATKKEARDMPYSVSSFITEGYSALFEAYKKLGLNVKVDYVPVEEMTTDRCYIIVDHGRIDQEGLFEWVQRGGILVYIVSTEDGRQEISCTDMGEGRIICVEDEDCLTNAWLLENRDAAYELYTYLVQLPEEMPIIFNEYYMYEDSTAEGNGQKNLWSITPLPIKLLILQGGLCIILFFFFAGRRFGKAQALISEVERTENEYIYSVAEIYKRAGAWDVVLGSYYHEMKNRFKLLTRREGDFLALWREEKMSEEEKVRQLLMQIEQLKNKSKTEKLSQKEVMPLIEQIEYFVKIIDKRRKQYWKL